MRHFRSALPALATVLVLALGLGGCEEDVLVPEPVERADLVGDYQATAVTVTVNDETTDLLDEGVELTLTLREDGTTEGRLFFPEGGEDGRDLDAQLDGTWSFDAADDQVTFDQLADTFVRDMTFSAIRLGERARLRGQDTYLGGDLEVVLDQG